MSSDHSLSDDSVSGDGVPNDSVPDDSVTVSVLVTVDPATAFAVFTEEIDAWWKRGPAYRFSSSHDAGVMRFEPGVGGRLVEVFDEAENEEYEVGRVLVWEPAQRLVFEFRPPNFEPDQCTEVEVRFAAVGQDTRVSVEHRGWAGLPPDHPVRHGLEDTAFEMMRGHWWLELLRTLRIRAGRRGGDTR